MVKNDKFLKLNLKTLSEEDVTNEELDNVIADVRKDISKASDNNEKKYLEKLCYFLEETKFLRNNLSSDNLQ